MRVLSQKICLFLLCLGLASALFFLRFPRGESAGHKLVQPNVSSEAAQNETLAGELANTSQHQQHPQGQKGADPIGADAVERTAIRLTYRSGFKYPHVLEKTLANGRIVEWVANHLIIGINGPTGMEILDRWTKAESHYSIQRISENIFLLSWGESTPEAFLEEKAKWNRRLGKEGFAEEDFIIGATAEPSDPFYSEQSYLPAISAPEAWQIRTTAPGLVVAVLDSGISMTHPDLMGAIAVNPGEIDGNGIDDDNNGFVDDVFGWDFVEDDSDPSDVDGHGTAMAGLIGATWNNIGIAGICEEVEILPVRFLDDSGYGTSSDEIRAIDYILESGAKILNASFGGPFNSLASRNQYRRLRDAGIWVVASAGNDGIDTDSSPNYPSAYDFENILSVGALNKQDNPADFSNYGKKSVDIFAPGVGLISTGNPDSYADISGTSPAAALTSGALALVLAEFPAASMAEIRDRVITRSRFNSDLNGICVSSGVLDVGHSVLGGDGRVPLITSSPESAVVDAGSTVSLTVDFIAYAEVSIQWYFNDQPISSANTRDYEFLAWDKSSEGDYSVEVTTPFGSVRSASARIDVIGHIPEILNISKEAYLAEGRAFQLSVFVKGSEPISYQWFFGGEPISGAVDSVYAVPSATLSMEGNYTVLISNRFGSLESPAVSVKPVIQPNYNWREISVSLPSEVRQSGELYWDVAAGLFSPDLEYWNHLQEDLLLVPAYANGVYWSLNQDFEFVRSYDGSEWTVIRQLPEGYYEKVVAGNGYALVLPQVSSPEVTYQYVRFDLETLAYRNPSWSKGLYYVFFDGEYFRSRIGDEANYFSPDGIDWQLSDPGLVTPFHYDGQSGVFIGREQGEQTSWKVLYRWSRDLVDWQPINLNENASIKGFSPGFFWGTGFRFDMETTTLITVPFSPGPQVIFENVNYRLRADRFGDILYLEDLYTGQKTVYHEVPKTIESTDKVFAMGDTFYIRRNGRLYRLDNGSTLVYLEQANALLDPTAFLARVEPGFALFRTESGRLFRLRNDDVLEELFPNVELPPHPYAFSNNTMISAEIDGYQWYSEDGEFWQRAPELGQGWFYKLDEHIIFLQPGSSQGRVNYRDPGSGEWSVVFEFEYYNELNGAVTTNGFCITGGNQLYTSADGKNWSESSYPGWRLESLTTRDNLFFLEIDYYGNFWASVDGLSWFPTDINSYPVFRTSKLLYSEDGLFAEADGTSLPRQPIVFVNGGDILPLPANWTIGASFDNTTPIQSVELYENGVLLERQFSANPEFNLQRDELGWNRYYLKGIYANGYSIESLPFDLAVSAGVSGKVSFILNDVDGNPEIAQPPGVEYFPYGEAVGARIIKDGRTFSTTNGVLWSPLPEFSAYSPGIFDPVLLADGSVVVPLNVPPVSTVIASILPPGGNAFVSVFQPRDDIGGLQGIYWDNIVLNNRYFVFYHDGDIYEFLGQAGWRYVGNLDVERSHNDVLISISNLVILRTSDYPYLFVSEDCEEFTEFPVPEGWYFQRDGRFRNADGLQTKWLLDINGTFSPVVKLPPLNVQWKQLSENLYTATDENNVIWFCNPDGRVFPLSVDQPWSEIFSYPPFVLAMLLDNEVVLFRNTGEVRTLVQHDLEAANLRYGKTEYGTNNEISFSLNLVDRGVLDMPEGAEIKIDCLLHPGTIDAPGIVLPQITLPIGGLRPYEWASYTITIPTPAGLTLGNYVLSGEIDADDAFEESNELNNSIASDTFFYNPKVGIQLQVAGNGWVESDTAEASVPFGTSVAMFALPELDAAFVAWDGSVESRQSAIELTVDRPVRLTAHFVPTPLARIFPDLAPVGNRISYREIGGPEIIPVTQVWNHFNGKRWTYIPDLPELPDAYILYDMTDGWLSRIPGTNWYYNFNTSSWKQMGRSL